ncbi:MULTISPECIES: hypothetical protein [unclassified Peribacillus]|uniref:hypothetical protein n=1 Tax=unclassified Peribacillus TaxID=2675266 RepID=UPI001913CE7B|nr:MULTISPECIES: hypothetical protein [unclassified Peribacillus]MBK5446160.1 hypothetical protein [Peribacillus sp. TH24]MBK5480984.1 hypothetical protein [Peribacillus sp. TH16]MBK5502535.1 hypothetical protein [Peribacillus sp. TH14]WMX57546.1 hypothetical protein RE409_10165 [Peribacillus sp. R9-11]
MKNKKIYQVFIVTFLFVLMINHTVYAIEWEDEDVPISFKIEMLPWEIVNNIIPNKTNFTIIDIETGLSFKVQRRAGSHHADVQPLTKEDTQIMKKIYNNKWSWNRRAIIVLINNQMIAASMHGMPHGAGALQNGFSGHFCVHFSGSITHRLKNEDLSHKLMVLKAAGKLDDYIETVSPYELIRIFTISINQGNQKLLALTLSNPSHLNRVNKLIEDITYFGVVDPLRQPPEQLNGVFLVDVPVQVAIYKKREGKEKKVMHFMIRRDSLTDRWFIDQDSLYEDLK